VIARERFVYVHQPKTGGTFVTAALRLLPRPPRPSALRRRFDRLLGRAAPKPRKHGTCRDVPEAWRDRILVATVRNPFDRYVSQYEFGWWKGNPRPWIDAEALRRRFPAYPELTFPEYLEAAVDGFQRTPCPGLPPERRPGLQTEQFLWYYFRDPSRAMASLDEAYCRERRWEADMYPVRFLRVESLNRDLHDFLLEVGEAADRVAPILEMGKVLPAGSGKRKGRPWREYWTPELLARVAPRERLLLAMFPEYAP
jgi:hypothetical protein